LRISKNLISVHILLVILLTFFLLVCIKAFPEKVNKTLLQKIERFKILAKEKADQGFDISLALYLDTESKLAAKEGNFSLVHKLLDDAIKTLEDLPENFPLKRVIGLPVHAPKVIVTEGVPKYQTGQKVTEYKTAFRTKTVIAKEGMVKLEITSTPIYVEEGTETQTLKGKIEDSPFGFHPGYTYKEKYIDRKQINWITSTSPKVFGFDYKESLNIGVRWNRPEVYALWEIVQKSDAEIEESVYNWEVTDYVYGTVPKDMNLLTNIDVTENRLVREKDPWFQRTFRFKTKHLEEKYLVFVKKLVERYGSEGGNKRLHLQNSIRYWQVSNEPDQRTGDWEGYAHLLEITYKAVKESCPECKVVIGGLSSYPEGFYNFYMPIFKKMKGKNIDVFDFHVFGESWAWLAYKNRVETIKRGLFENGYQNTEIWMTETGTYSGKPKNLRNQTEKEQAEGLIKSYIYAMSLGVRKIFWAFGLIEGFIDADVDFDHMGLIYDGKGWDDPGHGTKKLSYYTYKMMTEKLEGSNFSRVETLNLDDRVYAFQFNKKGRNVYVLWIQ